MKKLSTLALCIGLVFIVAGVSVAQERLDKSTPILMRQMTGKVTKVDASAKTFTVIANGKEVTFKASKLPALPKVGEIVSLTFADDGGPGPMEATNLNSSKSNVN
jgi:hypothetical protein